MITKTVKYFDFNDNEVEKEFSFHLSKAELTEFTFKEDGANLDEALIRMSDGDTSIREVLEMLKGILRKAVGQKSEDGARFVKNDEIRSDFFDTDAYSELLFELLDDATKASEFITGILPRDIRNEYKKTLGGDDLDSLSPEELRARLKAARGTADKPEIQS